MTTDYTVEIGTADGHQTRRVEADGYEVDPDNNSLSLYVLYDGNRARRQVALFSGDKWVCVREQMPYQLPISDQVRVMETAG